MCRPGIGKIARSPPADRPGNCSSTLRRCGHGWIPCLLIEAQVPIRTAVGFKPPSPPRCSQSQRPTRSDRITCSAAARPTVSLPSLGYTPRVPHGFEAYVTASPIGDFGRPAVVARRVRWRTQPGPGVLLTVCGEFGPTRAPAPSPPARRRTGRRWGRARRGSDPLGQSGAKEAPPGVGPALDASGPALEHQVASVTDRATRTASSTAHLDRR